MNVLFINPPQSEPRDNSYIYPLGIASIISFLEENGYHPKFLEMFDFFESADLTNILLRLSPDIIGITLYSDNRFNALKLISVIKEINRDFVIIIGGHHATFMYEQILLNYPVDVVVLGEGEITFLELVRCFEKKESLERIDGIAYINKNRQVIKTPFRRLIIDLNSLPMPAYHHFDLKKKNCIQVVFSRGCPFKCIFCSESSFWNHKYRVRNIKKSVDEIEFLSKNYGIKVFDIYDAIFSINSDRINEFCEEMIKRRINVEWGARLRVDNVTKNNLTLLKKANCVGISFGVESGSQKILNHINKKISVKQIQKTFRMTHDVGMKAYTSIMVGNPGESLKSLFDTDSLLKKIKPYKTDVIGTKIYPGTKLYCLAKDKGIIEDSCWLKDESVPRYTESFNNNTIKFYCRLIKMNQFPTNISRWKIYFFQVSYIFYYLFNNFFVKLKKIIKI